MKILMAIPHDLYYEPWTTRPIELSAEFVKMGHEVTLFYWPIHLQLRVFPRTRNEMPEGVRVIPAFRGRRERYHNMKRLLQLTRDVDVIEFQKSLTPCAFFAMLCARVNNKPVCYDWDDNESSIVQEWQPTARLGAYVYSLERLLPRLVSTLCVSSMALKEKARALGVSDDRMFDAPVGAKLDRFDPSDRGIEIKERYGIGGKLVVYLGQLQGASYGELFMKAAEIIGRENKEPTFMVVGGGERLAMLKSAAEGLGLGNRLIFTDYVPHEEIPHYLAAADIGVATFALNETTVCKSPLKIVEYLAAGRPIVASDVGDVSRMVGDAGIVVGPDDPIAIAKAVSRLLDDDSLRESLSQTARRRAEEIYNWKATALNMMAAFERAIEIGPKRSRLLRLIINMMGLNRA
ncbi:MAG: glycosyltransferase family 4 protein [Candidatus Coatesbacteria bacterium]|nr:glycosyltransferase family 4 protein [Candidatus Coatesbacteria bacterium]